jgi:hypothetical protein
LIQKWLKAGVMEQDRWVETKEGTPQGTDDSPNAKDNFEFDRRLGFRRKSGAD